MPRFFAAFCDKSSRTSVEPERVVYQPPHVGIENASLLTKHGKEVLPCPFESTFITRNAKRHFCRRDFDLRKPLKEPQEVRVGIRIEDDLKAGK